MSEISMLLAHDVLSGAKVKPCRVSTPLGACKAVKLSHDIIFVAILRAGLGMLDGLMKVHPEARLAHIGIYRDEVTLKPVKYYVRLPDRIQDSLVVLVDPMLATGGSAAEALEILKARGAKKIRFMALIGAKKGVSRLAAAHPDVPIYIGAVDGNLMKRVYRAGWATLATGCSEPIEDTAYPTTLYHLLPAFFYEWAPASFASA